MAQQTHCEEVVLATKGLTYRKELGIGEKVSIKPFTNKDMKGMYANAGESGVSILLENSINGPENRQWTVDDLLPQDRDLLLIRLRAITLGSKASFKVVCPSCGSDFDHVLDLDSIKVKYLDSGMQYPLVITLPDCGRELTYRLLSSKERGAIERMLDERARKFPKFNKTSERIFHTFASKIGFTDGTPSDHQSMYDFYADLSAMDATYLLFIEQQFEFGAVTDIPVTCPHCHSEQTFAFNLSSEFFRPTFEKPKGLVIASDD